MQSNQTFHRHGHKSVCNGVQIGSMYSHTAHGCCVHQWVPHLLPEAHEAFCQLPCDGLVALGSRCLHQAGPPQRCQPQVERLLNWNSVEQAAMWQAAVHAFLKVDKHADTLISLTSLVSSRFSCSASRSRSASTEWQL